MRLINEIIIHCAAANIRDNDLFEIVNQWHLDRGWSGGCGYHFLIRKDGGLVLGRAINKIGAHAKGHNRNSIGIMLNGDKKFTEHQFKALAKLCYNMLGTFGLSKDSIIGHYVLANKTCPNFDVDAWKQRYMVI